MTISTQKFAFDSSPLVQVEPLQVYGTSQVNLKFDEPLLNILDTRKLVALCAVANVLLERVQKLPDTAPCFNVQLLQDIEDLSKTFAPDKHVQTTLDELGLLELFPYLGQGFKGDKLEPVDRNPGLSYLTYVSLLNQVVMMGTQIYHDATVPEHHKYAAHQIALLYQTLNMLQGETKPLRRLVETHFDEIKSITESKNPYLPLEISEWLQEITWLCREEIRNCPPYIHRRLDPIVSTLRMT
uniref:Uncharacterized protein n=1 Tax=Polytomella parva TaxID=51329 RepID=A0A7S0UQN4_9CHLO|mmetsp:Transcript_17939/g.32754  ORF Transcript_17939/g.32754 Transcript_17939/m.32754 type:complete len:241 (+) Transcript_17939:83-805(+)